MVHPLTSIQSTSWHGSSLQWLAWGRKRRSGPVPPPSPTRRNPGPRAYSAAARSRRNSAGSLPAGAAGSALALRLHWGADAVDGAGAVRSGEGGWTREAPATHRRRRFRARRMARRRRGGGMFSIVPRRRGPRRRSRSGIAERPLARRPAAAASAPGLTRQACESSAPSRRGPLDRRPSQTRRAALCALRERASDPPDVGPPARGLRQGVAPVQGERPARANRQEAGAAPRSRPPGSCARGSGQLAVDLGRFGGRQVRA